jgi:DNA polymerase III epsilon subunit-like protein
MSKNPPIKPAKNKLSVEAQNKNIINEAVASLSVLNEGQRGTRLVTDGMAKTIAKRSLETTADEAYSLRRHRALADVAQFANAIKKDRPLTASASNADLLPIAHPQSARPHRLDSSDVSRLQARWYADDPRVTDPLVASLLASAFTAHPNSPEYEYSVARLSAMGALKVPLEALVAAYKPGANNFFWMRQLRGRDGRFIQMGGALRRFVRRLVGGVAQAFSLAGKMVSANPNSKKVTMELPNGKLVRFPAAEADAVKALIPSQQTADGFSKDPVRVSASDPVVDEADLEFADSPDGWEEDTSWEPTQDDKDYYGENLDLGKKFVSANDNYEVIKFEKANFPARNRFEMAQQKEAEENDVVAYGKGEDGELDPELPVYFVRRKDGKDKDFAAVQSWEEVQNLVGADDELYKEGKAPRPERPQSVEELANPELAVGNVVDYKKFPGDVVPGDPDASDARVAAYERKLQKFNEEGGEFPLDPRRSYYLMDDGTIIDTETGEVLRDSQGNTEPAETEGAPEPVAQLPEPEADELLEGFDYEKAKNDPDYVDAFLDGFDAGVFNKRKQDTADMSDSQKEGIDAGYALGDKKADEALELAKERFPGFGRRGLDERTGEELSEARMDVARPIYNELERLQAEAPKALTDRVIDGKRLTKQELAEIARKAAELDENLTDYVLNDGSPDGKQLTKQDLAKMAREQNELDGNLTEYMLNGKRLTKQELAEATRGGDLQSVPEGYYEVNRGEYFPEGAVDGQTSDDYTDDPAQLAQEYSTKDLKVALAEAVKGNKDNPANGFGQLPFSDGLEVVPAEALYKALDEKGEDADQILDDIYAGGDGDSVPDVAPETEVSLGEELPEAAQGEDSEQEIPPLIDGLTEDEKNEFLETGDYKKYLPKNKVYGDSDIPEGYAGIDNEPWTEIEGDLPEDAPDGFSLNPVDIANDYNNEDLIVQLRQALEPGNTTPGYGILGMDTPEGEEFVANVPAEAIRDALQLQGVDTDELIDAIFAEGFKGQGSDEPDDSEVQDAIDGENIEEIEDGGEPGEPGTDRDAGGPRQGEEGLPESDLLGRRDRDDESPWSSLNNPLPEAARAQEIRDLGWPTPEVFELDPEKDAEAFRNALIKLKENNKFAAAVFIYDIEDLKKMRLFATADGTAGFAIKPDGDIVSVFIHGDSPHKGATLSMLAQAVEQGGTKLDAFDTVLPKIYAQAGFRPVSRVRWNDEFAPEDWDKEIFKKFNNGEPDVVAMVFDPTRVNSEYDPEEGEYYDDYDAAMAARDLELQAPEAPEAPEAPQTVTKEAVDLVPGDEVKMRDGTFLPVKQNFSTDGGPLITFDDGSRRGVTRRYDFDDVVEVKAPEASPEILERENVEERQEPTAESEKEKATPAQEQAPQDEAGPETDVTPVRRDELTEEEKQELDAAVGEPFRTTVAVKDLQAGDIAVRDGEFFVIEEVVAPDVQTADQQNKKVNRATVKGYYPGRKSQERSWFANLDIEVIRGATPPAKGDAPALEKPELADYGRLKKQEDGVWGLREPAAQMKYEADYAEFKAQVRAAAENFDDPTKADVQAPELEEVAADKPADGPFIVTDRAENLQPGDISRKDRFVITRVFKDEATKAGSVSIEGYYPGYGLQRKEWKVNTPIEVIRGVPENEMPEQGEGSLHRPAGRGPRGGWFPDPDPAANAEHERKLEEARNRWQEPANLPVVAADDAKGENQLQGAPLQQPTPPFVPGFAAFQGFFADIAKAAQGKWQAFKDRLKDRDLIVFDFETTGFMPEDGNEPWQIAYRVIRNGKEIRAGGIFMNPGRSIVGTHAGDNAQVDGKPLTDEFLAKQMSQEDGFKWIKDKFGENPLLIAHNARFDVEILERKFKQFGIDFNYDGIADTMGMAEQFIKDDPRGADGKVRKKNLKAVAEWLGIPLDNWHDADADVDATSKIFTGLIEKGIELDQGLDALDADARQAEYEEKMARVQPVIDGFERRLAAFWADKAVRDAAAGIEVDLDEVQRNATTRLLPEGPIGNGQPMDNPETPEAPRPDLVDVEADSIFPDGRMRIVAEDWINNLDNVEQLFHGEIKVENLRPGDFVRAKLDRDKFWQVVAVRAGEEYGVQNFKRAVFVQNDEGQQRRVFWNQNAFLDEVRRPKNREDLVPTNNDPTPVQSPERSEDSYTIPVSVPEGKGIVKVNKDGSDYVAEAILQDEEGNIVYNANARNLDKQKAESFARRLVQVFAEALGRERRSQAGEEPESKSIAVGVAPDNAGEIPRVEQIDNLPFGKGENEITPKVENDDVVYESNARVIDEDGDVQAQVVEEFPSEKAASEGGRQNVEGASEKIARAIAERGLLMSPGRNRQNLPEIPSKYRRQVFIRLLAGLYGDADGNPLAIGDKVIHINPKMAAKYGEGVVIGKIQGGPGGLQRKGVVYVDYVRVQYPDGSSKKFVSRFQKHVDPAVARQRFEAEPNINWMNEAEMKEALAERAKKPRKPAEGDAPEVAEVEEVAAQVKTAVQPEQAPAVPDFEFNVDWIKANIEPQDIRVGDIQVGDFMVNMKGDNVGRVVQILDLDAAARIEVEYPNGRRWLYNPYNKNFILKGIYRPGGEKAPETTPPQAEAPEPEAPQGGPEAPQGEAPEAEAPQVEAEEENNDEVPVPAPSSPSGGQPIVGNLFNRINDNDAIIQGLEKLREGFLPKVRNNRADRILREAARAVEGVLDRMRRGQDAGDATAYGSILISGAQRINALAARMPGDKWVVAAAQAAPELRFLGDALAEKRAQDLEAAAGDLRDRQKDGLPQGLFDFAQGGKGFLEADALEKLEADVNKVLGILPENRGAAWNADRDKPDYLAQKAAGHLNALIKVLGDLKGYQPPLDQEKALEKIQNDILAAGREIKSQGLDAGPQKALYAELGEKFQNVYRDLRTAIEGLKDERVRKQLSNLLKPLPSVFIKEGPEIDRVNMVYLMQELIDRLPRDGDADNPDRNLLRARTAFEKHMQALIVGPPNVIAVGVDHIEDGIAELKRYGGVGSPEIAELVEKLEKQVDNIRDLIRLAPVDDFAGPDLVGFDPFKKAEERALANENLFEPDATLVDVFAQDAEFDSEPALRPFKDNIRNFFNGKANPLAALEYKARIALNKWVAKRLKNGDGTPKLVELLLQLDKEDKAYQPRKDVNFIGDKAQVLLGFSPTDIFSVPVGEELKNPDGTGTGWVKEVRAGGGVNVTQMLRNNVTGQTIWVKREMNARNTRAEALAAELGRMFDINGMVSFQMHPQDADVIFLTGAGEDIRKAGTVKMFRNWGGNNNDVSEIVDKLAIVDAVKMGILDAVIHNDDRHGGNFMVAEKLLYGVENNGFDFAQLIPIDHGFAAALNGAAPVNNSPLTYLKNLGAAGGKLNRTLLKKLGKEAYVALVRATTREARVAFVAKYGENPTDPILKRALDRIDSVLAVSDDQWNQLY